ncbi:8750_t:CDS:2 [Entrophospora sp. SA101]|nr:8750_t:CDS:2 [Entrophospora sp. SA101]
MKSADRELIKYVLSDIIGKKIEDIKDLLECFQKATLEMSKSSYPTFGSSVPVYSYLIDNIEDFLDEKQCLDDIVAVANRAKDKIQKYYPTLDGLVYVNATVIDSRLKMEYYNDNGFEDYYINKYKRQITNLWREK